MSLWKRTMDYLGLGPDEAYTTTNSTKSTNLVNVVVMSLRGQGHLPMTMLSSPTTPVAVDRCSRVVTLMPLLRRQSSSDDSGGWCAPRKRQERIQRTQAIRPARFDQAQEVADTLKLGQPVIMNLDACERDVARR